MLALISSSAPSLQFLRAPHQGCISSPKSPLSLWRCPGYSSWAEHVFHACSVLWESIELFPTNLLPHPEGSRYINIPGLIAFIGVSRELAASPTSSASVSGESPAPQGAGTGPPSTRVNGVAGLPGQLGGALLSTANGWGKLSHYPLNGSSSPSAGGARGAIPHGYGRKHSLLPSVMGMCRGRCRSLRSPPMTPPRQLASAHDAVLHVAL